MALFLNLHWYNLTCICIVTASTLASLFLIYKHRHKTDKTQTAKSLYESLLSVNGGNQSGVETETDISSFSFVERNCLWRSSWSFVHPGFLLFFRIIAMAVLFGTLSWDWWIYDASIFIYYTEWTFLLVIIYFLIGALISAQECWLYYYNNKKNEIFENSKIEEGENVNNLTSTLIPREYNNNSYVRAGILGYSMQIIYQICGGAVILTDVVFWCLLAPLMKNAHFQVNLVMGCMHSLNLLFLLIDTTLNNMNFPMFRMAYFVIWSCIYVIFQWILHLLGFSWWPYPFLKLSTPWAPLWYIGMALVHIPCYMIYWLIVKAKNTYFPILFPNCYVRLN